MSGYVRIHRTLIDHPAFRTDAEAMAFAWLVAKASWCSARVRYKGHGVCLERGQLAISVREFAVAMDRDKAWVERLFKRLKNEGMIETAAETPRETAARQRRDTEQIKEKGKKKKPIELPDWLDTESWEAFKRMRRAMRVPFTDDAERGILADLARLRDEGHDPAKVLAKAVKRGWRGVFGDDDTMAERRPFSAGEEIAQLRKMIPTYEASGRQDYAERARQRIAELEKPPDPAMAERVSDLVSGVVNRAA